MANFRSTRGAIGQPPFYVGDNRVMVSLGPLSRKKHCTFSCPFCYVHAGFLAYEAMKLDEIVRWISTVTIPYDIIYVSGDTDSFARPRTDDAVTLMESLQTFNTDLLFTTRALLDDHSLLTRLRDLSRRLRNNGKFLFGCVSIAQLHLPHLEPPPIPPPSERLAQLAQFKALGIVSVLAMRPFLPLVPSSEYLEIVELAGANVDLVLGEEWYSDLEGKLDALVFRGQPIPEYPHELRKMDFDANGAIWKVYKAPKVIEDVGRACSLHNVPFFMRSRPAIEYIRSRQHS